MASIRYSIRRYEKKYLLNEAQYNELLRLIKAHLPQDRHGAYTVLSLYFDTDDYAVIRACIDHPEYKEKFRLRSYGPVMENGIVFAEIKKKYQGITYKRRMDVPMEKLSGFLEGKEIPTSDPQIEREIHWFLKRYHPAPKVGIGYEREPYEDGKLRITFDHRLRWWQEPLLLMEEGDKETEFLPGRIVMEVKSPDTIPLWLVQEFSRLQVTSQDFSKYGEYYRHYLLPALTGREETQ